MINKFIKLELVQILPYLQEVPTYVIHILISNKKFIMVVMTLLFVRPHIKYDTLKKNIL